MPITKANLPQNSILYRQQNKYDYVDSFQAVFIDKENNIQPANVGKAFFNSGPKWVGKLFTLRNRVVSVLGLKTPSKLINRQKLLDNLKWEPGERVGLFKIFNKTDNEIVLGEDDRHLNFRVSFFLGKQIDEKGKRDLIVTTTVVFNNWFGRFYFLFVKPFHKLIVPVMLKGIIKKLEVLNIEKKR